MKNLVIFLFKAIVLFGCSTTQTAKQKAKFDFSIVEALRPGLHAAQGVLEALGSPDEKIELPPNKGQGIIWRYNEGDYIRITVYFTNGILQSVTWSVRSGDPEQDISFVKRKYQKNWKVIVVAPSTPHTSPDVCRMIDNAGGISIDVRVSTKRVVTISKWRHNSTPTVSSFSAWQADLCDFLNL